MSLNYGNFNCEVRDLNDESSAPSFMMLYDFEFVAYEPKNYRASGLFSTYRPPERSVIYECLILFSPFSGMMFHNISEENPQTSIFTDYDDAYGKLYMQSPISFENLATFETVNAHQWLGRQPITHENFETRRTVWTEEPMWDIATSDISEGERRVMMRGHVQRDYAFTIQQRLQSLADYCRSISKGWEDVAKIHASARALDPTYLPEDLRGEGEKFAQELRDRINETLPDWPWLYR
jgi:hypothetical protein